MIMAAVLLHRSLKMFRTKLLVGHSLADSLMSETERFFCIDDDGLGEMTGAHAAVGGVDRGPDPALLGDQTGEPHQCGTGGLHLGYQGPYHPLGELAYALP